VKLAEHGAAQIPQYDPYQHVNRTNNKIVYEDPLERKKRERELRIQREREEQAQM